MTDASNRSFVSNPLRRMCNPRAVPLGSCRNASVTKMCCKDTLYSRNYVEVCNEQRGPYPRLSVRATLLRRNTAKAASCWHYRVRFDRPGNQALERQVVYKYINIIYFMLPIFKLLPKLICCVSSLALVRYVPATCLFAL